MSATTPEGMKTVRPGTAFASLLRAAANSFDDREFSLWELIVEAWLADRTRFGLPHYAAIFPDSNAVKVELAGAKRRGFGRLILRTRPNFYMLTRDGLTAAAKLPSRK